MAIAVLLTGARELNISKVLFSGLLNAKKGRSLKNVLMLHDDYPDSDDTFLYIAGYTSGGAPYGVTWEEMGVSSYEDMAVDDDNEKV